MKYAANLLSGARILFLLALVFVYRHPAWFITLYLLAGLTDVLDGFVARWTHTESELGARLDSFADLLLVAAILIYLFRLMGADLQRFFPWILAITAIRCISLVFSALKYRKAVSLHTWFNKLTGFTLFLCPLLFALFHHVFLLWPVCVIALLSAAEEFLIHLTTQVPDVNRRSIFFK